MAAPNTNWVYDKNIVGERERIALERAKRLETKMADNGYRWYKVDSRTKIFIECDDKGKPTKRGQEMIDRYKSL